MRNLSKYVPLKTLFVAGMAIALAACSEEAAQQQAQAPQAPRVTVAKPVVKDIKEWDDFTGRFQAVEDVDICARVTGYVKAVHFDEGEVVKEGDILLTIDQRVRGSSPRAPTNNFNDLAGNG